MKTKNVIWGLVLVLIGTLFILKNMDVIYFSWHSIWKLWPVVLVLIGIAILPIKNGIKIILTIIALIIATVILIMSPNFQGRSDNWSFRSDKGNKELVEPAETDQQISEAFDTSITSTALNFDAAAGNFRIVQTTDELFEFYREGNVGRYIYSIKDLGDRREISIELEEGRLRNIELRNKVTMKLNPNPLWDLKIDVGAASLDLDLSSFRINKLNINGGASSINIKIGKLQEESRIKIDSGASSIKIEVPEAFACEVKASTVLSSKDLKGFYRVSDGTYVSENFSSGSKNVMIEIDAAVSSLTVERY